MVERITFLVNSAVICSMREFDANSLADTRQSRTAWPKGRIKRSCSGKGCSDSFVHPKSNLCTQREGVAARLIFRVEAKFGIPKGVQQHSICAFARREAEELDAKAETCILVGYSHEQKGYKCYNPWRNQV